MPLRGCVGQALSKLYDYLLCTDIYCCFQRVAPPFWISFHSYLPIINFELAQIIVYLSIFYSQGYKGFCGWVIEYLYDPSDRFSLLFY
jgi:hypothetical protein